MSVLGAAIVEVKGLGKAYGKTQVLSDVGFSINSGECFGLLGPNGAGKSTLIKIIYGVVARSQGDVRVLGWDPQVDGKELRKHLGVVMQDDALDEAMTVRGNMLMFCRFHGIKGRQAASRVDDLLESMSLTAKAQAKISALSGGMRRRLAFVRSLLSNPRLLILDEPTTGLDPAVRHALWDKIRELKRNGTTTILTTHYMDEAEVLCDRLVVIDQGRVKIQGNPKQLIQDHCPGYVGVFNQDGAGTGNTIRREYATIDAFTSDMKQGGGQAGVIRPSNLEDVFLKLTGRDLKEND